MSNSKKVKYQNIATVLNNLNRRFGIRSEIREEQPIVIWLGDIDKDRYYIWFNPKYWLCIYYPSEEKEVRFSPELRVIVYIDWKNDKCFYEFISKEEAERYKKLFIKNIYKLRVLLYKKWQEKEKASQ